MNIYVILQRGATRDMPKSDFSATVQSNSHTRGFCTDPSLER
jgi:hypothetical protein